MFEPREGNCFHCGTKTKFPSNWKNDWFICDRCLKLVMPLLRRKSPSALVFKSEKSVTYTSLWRPFKPMSLDVIRGALDFALENAQLEDVFEPSVRRCDGAFELDEGRRLFRVEAKAGLPRPILPLAEVSDFYVQEVYKVGYKSYKHYVFSELTIETTNPHVPFVDFPFETAETAKTMIRSKSKIRREAEDELSDILGMRTSETRRRVIPQFSDLMEFNPYSVSQSDDYYETAADFFKSPE